MRPENQGRYGAANPVAQRGAEAGLAGVAGSFRQAWAGSRDPETASPELLPLRLARACLAVLPVDGAGLSLLNDDFRVPLGASDDLAGLAERLQFTVGEGPCLVAAAEQRIVVADAGQLQERWPVFAKELFDHTPFQAIVALPLTLSPQLHGAMDLFLTEPAQLRAVSLADALTVTDQVLEVLIFAQDIVGSREKAWSDELEPAWLHGPAARARTNVWVAMGILMTRLDVNAPDALAVLRSYAYGRDALLDDIAAAVINGDLDVTPDPNLS
jgi:hypothetical protein